MSKINENVFMVKNFLEQVPELRDDDKRLVGNIWYRNLKDRGLDINNMTAVDFIKLYAQGKVPSPHSITRCRRKLQEEVPLLRGRLWNIRHKKSRTVKDEIRDLTAELSTPAGG